MLDKDLACLYGVEVRSLNQAVKRNAERFPSDFMFQLNNEEWMILKSQFVISSWGGVRKLPYAFTEMGVAMLSSVLRSPIAIQVNINIMRAFVAVRQMVSLPPTDSLQSCKTKWQNSKVMWKKSCPTRTTSTKKPPCNWNSSTNHWPNYKWNANGTNDREIRSDSYRRKNSWKNFHPTFASTDKGWMENPKIPRLTYHILPQAFTEQGIIKNK